MSISNKLNLVLSNKVKNNVSNDTLAHQNYYRKNSNQADTFESSNKKKQVSFKGTEKLVIDAKKVLNSESYKKILGVFSLAALSLWAKLTNNGEKEVDLSQEEIEKYIFENMSKQNPGQILETDSENIIDVESKEIKSEIIEAPKKRRGRPPKNLKLEEGKQPDTNNAVQKIRRQQKGDVEIIRSLTEQGLTRGEIEAQTGIKAQQIERIAKKENITLVDGRALPRKSISKETKVKEILAEKTTSEKLCERKDEVKTTEIDNNTVNEIQSNKSTKQTKTPITKEIIEEVLSLSTQNIPQNEIAQKIGISEASVCRIISGELLLSKSAPVKELRKIFEKEISNMIILFKYTPEAFFDKYTAKSYRLYLQKGDDKFLNFATTKKNSQILTQADAIKSLLEAQNEAVPKNDSIYEDYKNCFDKKQFISRFLELRKEYVIDLLNKITQKEQYYKFQLLDNTENMTPEALLDILCKAKISKVLEKQELVYNKYLQEATETDAEEVQETAKQDFSNSVVNDEAEVITSKPEIPIVKNLSELGKEGYTKFLNGEIVCDEPLKNLVLQRYKNYLGGKEEISLEGAIECLEKVDKYLNLTEDEKSHIVNITNIFNNKKSKFEKKILEEIIDIEYLTKDTKIYNSFYGEDVVITTKAKKEIKNSQKRDYINILKSFESAAALHSKKKNDPGVREYFNDYSMEIRIAGNFGAMRLYSSKLCKDKNGNEIKNFMFDCFVSDH